MTEKKPDYTTAIVKGGDRSLSAPRLKLISRGLKIAESLEKHAETVIRDIIVEIDHRGFLTRRAIVDSVSIEGKPINEVSLGFVYNEKIMSPEWIEKYGDIRIGDTLIIDSLSFYLFPPKMVKGKRTGNEKIFTMPAKCPACGSKIETLQPDSAYYCTGTACPGRIKAQIVAFCDWMPIVLNPELLKELVYKRMISDPADLYFLKKTDLMSLNEMDEDSAQRALDAIEKNRYPKLENLVIALLVTGGFRIAKILDIADDFCSIDDLFDAKKLAQAKSPWLKPNDLIEIQKFMNESKTLKFLEKLQKGGVVFPKGMRHPARSPVFRRIN